MAKEDFYLSDEQRMICDLARKMAREKVAPHAAYVDEAETYPEASIQAFIDAGLFDRVVPLPRVTCRPVGSSSRPSR